MRPCHQPLSKARQNDCNRNDAIIACFSGHTTWQGTILCYNTNHRERKCEARRIHAMRVMSLRKWMSQPSRSPSASTTSPSSHARIVLSTSCGDCERNRSASASSSSPKSELPLPDRWRLSSHSFFSSSTSRIVLRRTRWRRKSSWRKFESSCANLRCLRPLTCWINQETVSPCWTNITMDFQTYRFEVIEFCPTALAIARLTSLLALW